ncbi:MAG: hypothetical protein FWE62_05825 [Firmicutes bacterium]|nr:hypothetical protein [Bacillota bacterium]
MSARSAMPRRTNGCSCTKASRGSVFFFTAIDYSEANEFKSKDDAV